MIVAALAAIGVQACDSPPPPASPAAGVASPDVASAVAEAPSGASGLRDGPDAGAAIAGSPGIPAPDGPGLPATVLDRVAVIGASASNGYGVRMPFERQGRRVYRPLDLASVLSAAIPVRTHVSDHTSSLFFMSPVATGARQVTLALEQEPTLLLALDFLFWYVYGDMGRDTGTPREAEARLERLERGLLELDRFSGPRVVGDLPDMSDAVGRMLRPAQMPSAEALRAANARVSAWAADRPDVRLFPLSTLVDQMRSGESLRIGTYEWAPADAQKTLQWDRLHPTVSGLIAITQQVAVCIEDGFGHGVCVLITTPQDVLDRLREAHDDGPGAVDAGS